MASAAGVSLRRRSTGGRPSVAVAATSSVERALIVITCSHPYRRRQIGLLAPGRNSPVSRIRAQIGTNGYVSKEWLTLGKCVAVTGEHAFDHRLLREMREDAFAQRLRARHRRRGIIKRFLHCFCHAIDITGRKH